MQQQSELLRALADDTHYAANIFNYTAFDIDCRSLAARQAGWENTSGNFKAGVVMAEVFNEEEDRRVKVLLKENQMMRDVAEQVKTGLKTLIEVVRQSSGPVDTDSKNGHLQVTETDVESEATSINKANLTIPIEHQLSQNIPKAKRVDVDSSQFIPAEFHVLSTPSILQPSPISDTDSKYHTPPSHIINTLATPDPTPPRRARGRPRGSKNRRRDRICTLEISTLPPSKHAKKTEPDPGLWPPTKQCNVEEMEKELLAWIPSKICTSPLPVDETLGGLMMRDLTEGKK